MAKPCAHCTEQGRSALVVIPVFLTEYCPDALRAALLSIRGLVAAPGIFTKQHFSAPNKPGLPQALKHSGRDQVLVSGMGAHVCVRHTMPGPLQADYRCWPAADAVGTRRQEDRKAAVSRLRDAGVTLASAEMALFEWAGHAEYPAFCAILSPVRSY